ncbi:MAG: sigma-54 dependent transcriptional regulator [Abditibacteriales bacterium]|nr:sigma-54 dependent transcriptional regulator [Abditibacteriales bacterium]MDW8365586.1 sigma-54 dependent transcriptional regulator [Abditibacteriales bacterium]
MRCKVLIADDEPSHRRVLREAVARLGHEVITAVNGAEAVALFERETPDLVLLDMKMPEMDGFAALEALRGRDPNVLVVMVTAFGTIESAVQAIKSGAFDFLAKPIDHGHLHTVITKALEHHRLRRENHLLREELRALHPDLIAESPRMKEVLRAAERIAQSQATVLLTGETGTGKGVVARLIHRLSPRASRPFVKVNCPSIPADLLETEFFGHEKGAFTGAEERRRGRFELADGGTLFLDEIGDLPIALQTKLLRVLEDKEFERVGSAHTIKVDVRIIAATNRDLEKALRDGSFREDLFYRLHVANLHIPPLRERPEDIEPLAFYFLHKHAADSGKRIRHIAPDALQSLKQHLWRGNVRELENTIQRAVLMAEGDTIEVSHLALPILAPAATAPASITLAEMEKQFILQTLARCGGNRTQCAKLLGLSVRGLRYKLRKFGM